jgi:hypothetical protein
MKIPDENEYSHEVNRPPLQSAIVESSEILSTYPTALSWECHLREVLDRRFSLCGYHFDSLSPRKDGQIQRRLCIPHTARCGEAVTSISTLNETSADSTWKEISSPCYAAAQKNMGVGHWQRTTFCGDNQHPSEISQPARTNVAAALVAPANTRHRRLAAKHTMVIDQLSEESPTYSESAP